MLCVVVLLLGSAALASGFDADEQYADGMKAAKEARWQKAEQVFADLIRRGYTRPEVYFNLGNALFKQGKLAPSIVAWERARRLDPLNDDIQANLRIAYSKTVDEIEPAPRIPVVEWWESVALSASTGMWAWCVVFCVWAYAGLILAYRLSYLGRVVTVVAICLLGVPTAAVTLLAATSYSLVQGSSHAVVIEPNAYAKHSPDVAASDAFVIHEGTLVEVVAEDGEWVKAKLPNGYVGWLPAVSIEKI